MTAYAIRHKANQIHLFYSYLPGLIKKNFELHILDVFAEKGGLIKISTHALEVQREIEPGDMRLLKMVFEPLKEKLKKQFNDIFENDK